MTDHLFTTQFGPDLTEFDLRAVLAARLGLDPAEITSDSEPFALGLDSLGMMAIINRARRGGVEVTFEELTELPTFGTWEALVRRRGGASDPVLPHAEVDESAPFDLAPMQHAYWAGRLDEHELGGVATHLYHEFDGHGVDPQRLEDAVRALMRRHGMLRVAFADDGTQRILDVSPWPGLTVHDLREDRPERVAQQLSSIRDAASHRMLDISVGEVFDVAISLLPSGATRIHVNLDMIAADAASFRVLMADLARLYEGQQLPDLAYSYPRYLADRRLAEQQPQRQADRARARAWWQKRRDDFPGPPDLPRERSTSGPARVRRHHHWLDPHAKAGITHRAHERGVTPAMVLATAFAEALGGWSAGPRFMLNLPLFDREDLDPDVDRLVGDFSSSILLAVDVTETMSFRSRAEQLQRELRAAITHSAHPGVEVLRDLSRAADGERVLAPVVYTSALNLGELFDEDVRRCFGTPVWLISQGPQVWLDAQVTEFDGGILVNWDVREDIFPAGVVQAMFEAYRRLVDRLACADDSWEQPVGDLRPSDQRERHTAINATSAPQRLTRLHEGFFEQARSAPRLPALHWLDGETPYTMAYDELSRRALAVAAELQRKGIRPGDTVAVTLPKGPSQVVAVLGVLAAGGVYVPVGTDQPIQRRRAIHASADIGLLLTTSGIDTDGLPGDPVVVDLHRCQSGRPLDAPVLPDPDDAAYVLFTSGSTGSPKGVEITHRGATNTVEDLTERFGIGTRDRVMAVSALNFDLSVYDIFGLLAVGGAVVVTDEKQRRDAEAWLRLWQHFPVTVWNSVPILCDMLLTAAESDEQRCALLDSLRLVMLGGDWVGLDLPDRLRALAPRCRCTVLGGATEASIQSVLFEVEQVDPQWRSIPYGHPLRNQLIRVVDSQERDRPDLAAGELWLGGTGVGGRYRGDEELTADRFVTRDGARWYRTGDLVRRRLDGELEILGRTDFQVKVAGNRIDLGEIEAAVRGDERVRRAVAVALTDGDRPPRLRVLVAAGDNAGDEGLVGALVTRAADLLPSSMMPEHIAAVPELPLSANGKIDRRAVEGILSGTPISDRAHEAPRGLLELAVAEAWARVLGVERVGRNDDFFRLGGDSLTATRSVAVLREQVLAEGARVGGVRLGSLLQERSVAGFAATLHVESAAHDEAAAELRADPDARNEPFELTEVQHAYLLGRDQTVVLGGIGANFYLELDGPALDQRRWQDSWQRLIDRHDMLRAVVTDGQQQVLESVDPYVPAVRTAADADEASALLQPLRHRTFDLATWPCFETETVNYGDGRARVGLVIDPAVFDGLSVKTILAELATTYADPHAAVSAPGMTFRDYVRSVRPTEQERARAEAYWTARLDSLPAGPALPLAADPATLGHPRFERRAHRLSAEAWDRIKDRAREHGLTPSAVLLTSYAGVLSRWSAHPELTLNLTLFDRRAVHPDIDRVVGDFSSLVLLEHRPCPGTSWLHTAQATQRQLALSLENRAFSAVQVQQRLVQQHGLESAVFPVVFTSTLGVGGGLFDGASSDFPAVVDGGSQTPQVWLDHQVIEQDGALLLSWDSVQGLFPDGLVDTMFAAYLGQLEQLAQYADWDRQLELLPDDQRVVRAAVNATGEPTSGILHAPFFEIARHRPDAVALFWGNDEDASYGLLADRALRVAAHLRDEGMRPGDTVGVSLPKGPDQVVAVLGVLAAGGIYVPIGIDQPRTRRERIMRTAGIRHLITDLDQTRGVVPLDEPYLPEPGAPAYIIFTSGSTGEPKGVQMSHRAATNTISDITRRFGIGAQDRALAVSALEFDLSVYDIFGLLGAGGALVLVGEAERRDPDAWHRLALRHGVTLWNTVPMLLDMFVTAAAWQSEVAGTLRVALVSGDWVGLDLGPRLKDLLPRCRLIAMGGATEAGIWSNHFEVGAPLPGWTSVPYGRPLGAQQFRVVDALGRDCPDWVPGELWIGGASLADGYQGDPERTAESFPTVDGTRWYRTGDIGRYRPGGLLEFQGRRDSQVKVRGHRVELGEIEAALITHPAVRQALPVLLTGSSARLGAVVVGDLDAASLRRHAATQLPAAMVPDRFVVLDRLPLTANGKADRSVAIALLEQEQEQTTAVVLEAAPTVLDRVRRTWVQVLGVERVGPESDFFALGGDSLAATRVVALLRAPDRESGEVLSGAGVGILFARPVLAEFAAALQPVLHQSAGALPLGDADSRFEPFPLTEVQQAYLRGRGGDMPLGGIGTTYFLELAGDTLDVDRWQEAWRRLIGHHDMLRVLVEDGLQRVLQPDIARTFEVSVGTTDDATTASRLLRQQLCGRSFPLDQWPSYATMVVRHPGGVRVGVVVDYLPLDGYSVHLMFSELAAMYADPAVHLPALELTFRDYVLGAEPAAAEIARSQAYWNERLTSLPPAPQLPLAHDPATVFAPRFTRREGRLEAQQWGRVKQWAREHAVTPSAVLLACYASVLSRWSARAELTLNLTLFDRRDVHPQVGDILGDFTTLLLLEHRPVEGDDVLATARRLQKQLAQDLDHRATSAVWVQRELARRTTPAAAAMPVVFTSTLGMSDDLFDRWPEEFPRFVAGASQTPQVWLDHQVMEQHGELVYHWDAAEDLFADDVLEAMFAAYRGLVEALPDTDLDRIPEPERPGAVLSSRITAPADPSARTAPQGAVEECMARLWRQLLDVDRVHREDSFFTLGGDSLLATRLIARAVESGLGGVALAGMFARPVLQDFCADLYIIAGESITRPVLEPEPDQTDEPFEATDVQRAYWVGRHKAVTLGGVGAYYYSEFDGEEVDLDRMERAWNLLIHRHAELRSVFTAEGRQRLLARDAVPTLRISNHEIGAQASAADVQTALHELREQMSHQVLDPSQWPLFDVRAVTYPADGRMRTRLGVGLDNIVLDGLSMMIVFSEVEALYRDLEAELPTRTPTFRDYRTQIHPTPAAVEAAQAYWGERLNDLPPGPRLPVSMDPAALGAPRFVRHQHRVPAQEWRRAKAVAAACELTPAVLLLSCYAEVLSRWSADPDLTITLTLFDRRDVHPEIDAILGDFTSLLLLAYRTRPGDRRIDRARRLRDQLARDLAHRDVSAVWVQREQTRRTGVGFGGAPVVFTSGLGLGGGMSVDPSPGFPQRIWGISQTPQIWLDQQVSETPEGDLVIHWDAVEGLIPTEVREAMFATYCDLVRAAADAGWGATEPGGRVDTAWPCLEDVPTADRVSGVKEIDDGPPRPGTEQLLASIWTKLLGGLLVRRSSDFFSLGGDSLLATRMVAEVHRQLDVELSLREIFLAPTLAATAARCDAGRDAVTDLEEGEL